MRCRTCQSIRTWLATVLVPWKVGIIMFSLDRALQLADYRSAEGRLSTLVIYTPVYLQLWVEFN